MSVGFSRQEYWSGWPFPPPGDLPDPGTEPASMSVFDEQCNNSGYLNWQGGSTADIVLVFP